MPRRVTRAAAVDAVRALPRGRTVWVGVDGFGGAGKTTLAGELAAAVPGAAVIETDDLQGPGVAEWDWPRLHEQVVVPLRRGRTARYEVWRWGDRSGSGWREIDPGRLIVVEGVSATRRDLSIPWDLTIWVDADPRVRSDRIAARDGAELEPLWLENWLPSEEAYAARERPQERVDLIVDGTS